MSLPQEQNMAGHTLTTLPAEILLRICSLLYESHIPSLKAFLLGSKHCFAIAAAVLADTITFSIDKPAQLFRDVEKCMEALGHRVDLFQHVRRLVIVGCMDSPYLAVGRHGGLNPNWEDPFDPESNAGDGNNPRNGDDSPVRKTTRPTWRFSLPTTTDWDVTHGRLHGLQFGSEHGRGTLPLPPKILNPYRSHWSDDGAEGAPDNAPASAAYDSDHHWQPLADLISQLPGLADVVYRCTSQFPPCLLKAMHANDNPPRLHLQMFKLRSAYDGSATIDPHEWEIIRSPCLHSIWLQYRCPVRENGDWLPSRQLDTLRRIVQQGPVSPGLKEVKMVYEIPSERGTLRFFSPDETGTMPDPASTFQPPAETWNPGVFFNQEQHAGPGTFPPSKGHQLTHLKFDSGPVDTPDTSIFGHGRSWIEKLDSLTDFSLLRSLALVRTLSDAQLSSLKSTCLPNLATLSLACGISPGWCSSQDGIASRPAYFRTIADFLSGLPSLTALQIAAWDHDTRKFSFHGPRLEKLALTPVEGGYQPNSSRTDVQFYLTLKGLKLLVSSFPCLTDLSVSLKRSRGDSAEVALYKYIGQHLPFLRRLSLWLDCRPPDWFITRQVECYTPFLQPYPSPALAGQGWRPP